MVRISEHGGLSLSIMPQLLKYLTHYKRQSLNKPLNANAIDLQVLKAQSVLNLVKAIYVDKSHLIKDDISELTKFLFKKEPDIFLTLNFYALFQYPSITYTVSTLFNVSICLSLFVPHILPSKYNSISSFSNSLRH